MKCSLGISNFLEEISSLSHSIVFIYFFALISEEGFLISFLLFFGTLHSDACIFPFLLCFSFIYFSQWTKMDWNGWILLKWPLYLLLWAESLRRNGVAIMVNKKVWNAVLGCNLKNNRMISICFQGKPFNITVIQVYAPTNNAEEAEVERFYEDL